MNERIALDLLEDVTEMLNTAAPGLERDPIGLAEDLCDLVASAWDRALVTYRDALLERPSPAEARAARSGELTLVLRVRQDPGAGCRLTTAARPLPGQLVALDLRAVRVAQPADLADVLAAVLPACLDAGDVALWGRAPVTRPIAAVLRQTLPVPVQVTADQLEDHNARRGSRHG